MEIGALSENTLGQPPPPRLKPLVQMPMQKRGGEVEPVASFAVVGGEADTVGTGFVGVEFNRDAVSPTGGDKAQAVVQRDGVVIAGVPEETGWRLGCDLLMRGHGGGELRFGFDLFTKQIVSRAGVHDLGVGHINDGITQHCGIGSCAVAVGQVIVRSGELVEKRRGTGREVSTG